ncbi:MAG: DUF4402 domain-containing protein [Bacteroidales bacterium]|nr:DUF4402 domain-containing protein [Bacteroidales bacterium]
MKTTIKIFSIALVSLGFSATSFAQNGVSATATATSNIIAPIAITKNVDMNFGNVAVLSNEAGTVVLAPAGGRTRTGGVTLPSNNGTVAAAQFTVTGQANYTYAITLPNSINVVFGTNNMTVDQFTCNYPTKIATLTSGTSTLNVGATLNVNANQAAGTYVSGEFEVSVNYN